MTRPELLTFDVFGTIVDWRTGMEEACATRGRRLMPGELDRVIDLQGDLEQREYDRYTSIVLKSLAAVLGVDGTTAAAVAESVGGWPLFPDSREALRRLMRLARCAAITNSDRQHGEAVQAQLGFPLSGWICAEDVRHYKPSREMWDAAAERLGATFGPRWWHVSAYSDYDLATARGLGLTAVFVERAHRRPGPADLSVPDLAVLAEMVETG